MNDLKIIEQREVLGKEFKIYGDFENPLFLAKDVANCIEHSDISTMMRTVDDNEKLIQTLFVSGQNREMWFLTEDGLYEVLMQSRKPIAKEFKREVKQIINNPDFMIEAFKALKEEREARKSLEEENEKLQPLALFAKSVSASRTSILVGELAKLLKQNGVNIGQTRLFAWLRDKGYLMKSGSSRNMPTQRAMEQQLFEIKESSYINSEGVTVVTKTTKVSGKGQVYFVNLFLGENKE